MLSQELVPIIAVAIRREPDVVAARQRARHVSELLGFGRQDQVRIATAVSEVARNAYQYGQGGRAEFCLDLQSHPQILWIQIHDNGPGIEDVAAVLAGDYTSSTGLGIGLIGSKRLMDQFLVTSTPGQGTTVALGKYLPGPKLLDQADIGRAMVHLAQQPGTAATWELESQNRDLLLTLDMLRARETELERRKEELARLNVELEETNRGVVALYAELDEKAVALRRADEMKSRFLWHVSHEFRTPVNSVLALSQLLLQRIDGDLTPEQEKQVSYIRQAVQQLGEMVNDLLDLAKVEAGKTEIRPALIDVAQLLGALRAIMKPLATIPDVTLVFDDPAFGLTLVTDEGKLGQILRNLVSNALKFTQQGEVRVSAELVEATRTIIFQVRDTGIGIAPADQERIFQEFAQIDSPLQRNLKGTGLGLPLSRRLAVLLGGTLDVQSEAGKGALFTLSLPQGAVELAPEQSAFEASDTILIVDDDPAVRYLTQQMFRGSRFQTVEATGADAAERARFDRPALIILDLMMPDRSGFDVLRELRLHDATRSTPVVIHTSKELSEADYARLGGQQVAILPKGRKDRLPALMAIRTLLEEPTLFSGEPEFQR